ncbi:DNA-binding response regulator, NarL/FixJ family, contains REC and HTH domains [Flavobacterium succinicans]|uniref:DNA-binding response regulator, NarL/FixJ family, contains REC and HTH domains n=1 Tax=Flavobacterium succinicans TaxID=29536 RepID=A0A1I4XZQ8_9FLAO|nr:response regulator transcription factor [Flavobacterium succinicans]SFN31368.1 DNA-binding response regulator, NarL/FixJ family, contains REC and HTH domains [Flavobacterium succinicans]
MFQKVLIVDDIDFNDVAAVSVLEALAVPQIDSAKYCDDALLKLKKAYLEHEPYDLLITDLSFKADHRANQLTSGEALIEAVKGLFPEIKIIAFSIEDKSYRIKSLFDHLGINGFVMKGRNTMIELRKAVEAVASHDAPYLPADLQYIFQDKLVNEIDDYDIQLLEYLSQGVSQEAMESVLKQAGITPNSKSTIEKRISKLKIYFKALNTTHLVSITKDLGLI